MSIQDEVIETTADDPAAIVCGTCGKAWLRDITPAGRCPWEADHPEDTPQTYNAHPLRTLPTSLSWEGLASLNKEAGYHFFDRETIRSFGSRLLGSPSYIGTTDDGWRVWVGVTSEYTGWDRDARAYTVRVFMARPTQAVRADGRTIDPIDWQQRGDFLSHDSAAKAHRAMAALKRDGMAAVLAYAEAN